MPLVVDDLLEHLARPLLADLAEDAGQPVGIFLLDAEPALPLRVGEVLPRLRQLLFLHELGVVGLHEHVEPRAHPFAVRTDRRGDQVGVMRALDELENLLARQRLQLGSVGLDDVDGMAAGARFLKRAVEDGLGAGAPDAGLDAVLLLVGLDDRTEVGRLRGRVDRDLAFALRALDQPLQCDRRPRTARDRQPSHRLAAGADADPQPAVTGETTTRGRKCCFIAQPCPAAPDTA